MKITITTIDSHGNSPSEQSEREGEALRALPAEGATRAPITKTVTILHVNGSLDAESIAAFKKVAYPLLEKGCKRLVLDGSTLQFVDSMGLGVLISILRKLRQSQGDFKVASLNADVRSIFEITRLHRLFDCCSTVEAAVTNFS